MARADVRTSKLPATSLSTSRLVRLLAFAEYFRYRIARAPSVDRPRRSFQKKARILNL